MAGPGFINLRVSGRGAGGARGRRSPPTRAPAPARSTTPRRVLVDYGGPNVAKEMHVGHLRASIIGEAIKRLYRFRGDEVLGDAHFGDWGFQMGLLISAVLDEDPPLADLLARFERRSERRQTDEAALDATSPPPSRWPTSTGSIRPPPRAPRPTRPTASARAGPPPSCRPAGAGYRLLWSHFATVTRAALERDFHALGVDFDLWKGESDVNDLIEPMVAELRAKGLLFADQGAEIIRVARNDDKRELPPLLVVSSEGSAMYGTTDLATILDRKRYFDPDQVLYVVDQRQADHFEVVFRAAYLAGYAAEGALEHVGFGTMNGPDGKPFKTRAGGVLKLRDLIEMITGKARERLHEAGLGAELRRGRVRGHGAEGGGGGAEVRRPRQLPRHLLRLRPRPLLQLRGQDRPLPALPGGAGEIAAAPGRRGGRRARPDRRRRTGRARPGAGARRLRPRAGRGLRQAGPELHRRARLPPGRQPSRSSTPPARSSAQRRRCAASRLALAAATLAPAGAGADLLGIETPERM